MGKVIRILFIVHICLLTCKGGYAQGKEKDTRVPVAILDFIPAKNADLEDDGITATLHGIVTKLFTENSKFKILDRAAMAAIDAEIHTEQGEQFLNSKNLVTQGQLTGAKYIVSGIVSRYVNNNNKVSIAFSFNIIDLETGVSKYSNFIQGNNDIVSETTGEGDAVKSATNKIENEVRDIIVHIFHPDFHIIKLAEIDAKGRLQKVWIDHGEDFFSTAKKGGFWSSSKRSALTVTELEIVKGADGHDIKVFNNIGELVLDELKGAEASAWRVKAKDDGKKIIEHFNGDKILFIDYSKD